MEYVIQPTDIVHGKEWKNHKYISKKRSKNGKYVYQYSPTYKTRRKSTSKNDPKYYQITKYSSDTDQRDGSYVKGEDGDWTKIIKNEDGSTSISLHGGGSFRIGAGVKSYDEVKNILINHHKDQAENPDKYKLELLSDYEKRLKDKLLN